jgi:hypothetical protein
MGGVPNVYDDVGYAVVEASAIIPSSLPPFLYSFHCMLNHSKTIVVWYKGFPLSISLAQLCDGFAHTPHGGSADFTLLNT